MSRRPLTFLLRLLCVALALQVTTATAQSPDAGNDTPVEATKAEVDATLAQSRKQLDRLRRQMPAADTRDAVVSLREEANALASSNAALADRLTPQVANVEARLAELGPAPAAKGTEAADLTARRNSVTQQRADLDVQVRLARLLAIESVQLGKQLDALRRTRFEAQIGERTSSILSKPFWTELRASWAEDLPLLRTLAVNTLAAAGAASVWVWLGVLGGIAALFGMSPWVRKRLRELVSTRVPHGRIRRSLLALATVLYDTATMLVATQAVYWTIVASSEVDEDVESLLLGLVTSLTFSAFVATLGRALLAPSRSSWRLSELPDPIAIRMRHSPLLLGIVILVGWSLERIVTLVNAGLATTVAVTTLFSLALSAVLAFTMRRAEEARRALVVGEEGAAVPPRTFWQLVVVLVVSAVLVASVASLLLGYVALGSLLVKQVAWVLVVASSAYLAAVFVDDACMTWLATVEDAGEDRSQVKPELRGQIAVLLSALLRIAIVLVALVLMLGPLGQGPMELAQRTDQLRTGIAIGEIRILPSAILQSLLVLVVGIVGVRAARGWLLDRYLPTTSMDAGTRLSTATLLGYVGMVFAVALALSALGIGVERVAWVASALSVGIGFGLQAVVQNFVSGLILLTERPVRVGDWVALGGIEGDIRRINVRATEIQMGDRSTVIVPNSEFITKVVRNVTHANPLGLVQLKLPMPLDTDAERVRSLMLQAFADHEDVMADPEPNVQLDAIEGGNLIFSATGSVGSPRQAGGVKSALLFDILARLKAAGLALGHAPTMVLRAAEGPGVPGSGPG